MISNFLASRSPGPGQPVCITDIAPCPIIVTNMGEVDLLSKNSFSVNYIVRICNGAGNISNPEVKATQNLFRINLRRTLSSDGKTSKAQYAKMQSNSSRIFQEVFRFECIFSPFQRYGHISKIQEIGCHFERSEHSSFVSSHFEQISTN